MSTMIKDLTGKGDLVDANRLTTINNYNTFDKTTSAPWSLFSNYYILWAKYAQETKEQTKRTVTQQYEADRLSYVGAHAQWKIMTEKIKFYSEYLEKMQSEKAEFEEKITKNKKEIVNKNIELQKRRWETEFETKLNSEIANLTQLNKNYDKQVEVLEGRISRISATLTEATQSEVTMRINKDTKKLKMDKSKAVLDANSTPVYSDEESTLYKTVELDDTRMTYVPYQKQEAKKQDDTPTKTDEEKNNPTPPDNKGSTGSVTYGVA